MFFVIGCDLVPYEKSIVCFPIDHFVTFVLS